MIGRAPLQKTPPKQPYNPSPGIIFVDLCSISQAGAVGQASGPNFGRKPAKNQEKLKYLILPIGPYWSPKGLRCAPGTRLPLAKEGSGRGSGRSLPLGTSTACGAAPGQLRGGQKLSWLRNSDCWVGFRPMFGQTWPQNPSRTTGLVLHQKSAPQTNYNAISWQF